MTCYESRTRMATSFSFASNGEGRHGDPDEDQTWRLRRYDEAVGGRLHGLSSLRSASSVA
jgi:hypothetical protein